MPADQQIKAIIGNVCAYPQADGGPVLQSMPPSAVEIVERLQVCFTGLDKDASRAYVKPLAVKMDEFKQAYDFFRQCNSRYAYVPWHEGNAEDLKPDPVSQMPRCFAACMRTFRGEAFPASARQEGPAEAVETNLEPLSKEECETMIRLAEDLRLWSLEHGAPPRGALESEDFEDSLPQQESELHGRLQTAVARLQRAGNFDQEGDVVEEAVEEILRQHSGVDMEACVGVADEDMYMDVDKQWQQVVVDYKRILAEMQKNAELELAERSADGSSSSEYKNERKRAELSQKIENLKKKAEQGSLAEDARKAQQDLEQKRKPPGVQLLPDYKDCVVAELVSGEDEGAKRLLVPCATQPLSMFDAYFWPCAFPRQFPYGDGGFGLERDVAFTLEEYLTYILQREELEYPDPKPADRELRAKDVLATFETTLSDASKQSGLKQLETEFQACVDAVASSTNRQESVQKSISRLKDWFSKIYSEGQAIVVGNAWLVQVIANVSAWPDIETLNMFVASMSSFVGDLWASVFPGLACDLPMPLSSVAESKQSTSAAGSEHKNVASGQGSALRAAPRWVERDFVSGMYCYWRRRAYIRSARLFANRQRYGQCLQELGALDPEELFESIGHLKHGQGVKDLLRADNSKVSQRVKSCLRSLQLCMNNVLGTNSHRTFLRHVVTGYRNLWGAPLVFTTMNVADTKHPVMKLLYDGGEICTWRLLEQECPAMGSAEDMLRRVSRDPVSQAIFTDLMMRLFLKHMLGVRVDGDAVFGDGVAGTGMTGLFGDVQAYFAPLESQGRGGLHAHMCVWVLHPMQARILDKLRHGELGPEWKDRLWAWRQEVLQKVSTMQFDCVEEIARQAGADLGVVHKYRVAGSEEAQEAQEVLERHLAESCSPEAFLEFVGKSKKSAMLADRERLIGRLRQIESKLAPAGFSEQSSAAPVLLEEPCKVCGSDLADPHCPGCRPVAEELPGVGFRTWHMSLPWRGFSVKHDDETLRPILQVASACDVADLKSLAFFASVEWYCRSQTWKQRRCMVADDSLDSCKELLIGSIVSLLALLRSEVPPSLDVSSIFTDATDDCAKSFLEWHDKLLSEVPPQTREDAFLRCVRSADSQHEDMFSCPMAALCLIVSCYAVQVDASVSFLRQVFASLRKHASGLPVSSMADRDPIGQQYLRWRADRKLEFESRGPRAPDFYAEKLGLSYGDVPPLPLHHARQQRTCTDGAFEKGEAQVKDPPVQRSSVCEGPAFQDEEGVVRWRDGPVYEVPRQRPYAPLWTEPRANRGDPCSECPPWRRVPPYVSSSSAGGRAVVLVLDIHQEAHTYGRVFACDARRGYVRSHIHKCKKTCFKKSSQTGCKAGVAQVCRFNFVHGRDVLWLPRRWPGKLTPCNSLHCSFRASGDGVPLGGVCETSTPTEECGPLEIRAFLQRGKRVHDANCPADVPAGLTRRVARLGKRLVLPEGGSLLPHVGLDEAFGGVGKVNVLRYHPDCSSSHPALQVCFRCNFDVQCTDRVFVCSALREVIRRRRVKKSTASEHTDLSGVDANVREEPAPSLVAAVPQQQPTILDPHDFRPRLRSKLLGGAGIDDPEDFDFFADEPEPCDLELFAEDAAAPRFEDLFDDDHLLESDGVLVPLADSKPMDQDLQDEPMRDMLRDLDEEAFVEDVGVQRVELNIQRHWSDLIAAGRKKVEGRPNIGRAQRVNEGDYLVLNDVQCKVVRKRTYRSFRAMLESQPRVDDVTPGFELEDAVLIYHEFPNYEKLAETHGVVAFDIELTPDQPHWHGEKPVFVEQKEFEEYNVPPHQEHLVDWSRQERPWWQTAYEAFKRSYRVMSNIAHYQTDYATKSNPHMGNELSEQFIGVERLRQEEIRDGVRKSTVCELMEAGRRTRPVPKVTCGLAEGLCKSVKGLCKSVSDLRLGLVSNHFYLFPFVSKCRKSVSDLYFGISEPPQVLLGTGLEGL